MACWRLLTRNDRNWDAIAMHPLLPVAEAQDKQYVFFHCQLSNERTPRVAIGFKMWSVYRGHNMTVGMLEGGWADWKESGGPSKSLTSSYPVSTKRS